MDLALSAHLPNGELVNIRFARSHCDYTYTYQQWTYCRSYYPYHISRSALTNIMIHTIISHTHIFDETRSGTMKSLSSLVPLDIVISVVRIRFSRFDVVISTFASSNTHVFLITQPSLSGARDE
jgi:hypothetical protein